jgi:hypothetical protein
VAPPSLADSTPARFGPQPTPAPQSVLARSVPVKIVSGSFCFPRSLAKDQREFHMHAARQIGTSKPSDIKTKYLFRRRESIVSSRTSLRGRGHFVALSRSDPPGSISIRWPNCGVSRRSHHTFRGHRATPPRTGRSETKWSATCFRRNRELPDARVIPFLDLTDLRLRNGL